MTLEIASTSMAKARVRKITLGKNMTVLSIVFWSIHFELARVLPLRQKNCGSEREAPLHQNISLKNVWRKPKNFTALKNQA